MTNEHQIIGELPKNQNEKIIICKTEYRGESYLDIRTWWLPDCAADHIATKKGVSIKIRNLSELITILQTLDADLEYLNSLRGAA